MAKVRKPAVAGLFYPANRAKLEEAVATSVESGRECIPKAGSFSCQAIIAPHAGFQYSGVVAGAAYAALHHSNPKIGRIVLLGPAHRLNFQGVALSSAEYFSSPLGDLPIDTQALKRLSALPFVHDLEEAHAQEHSLETHLPFISYLFGEVKLIPLALGAVSSSDVAHLLSLLSDDSTAICVSSDLSHYLPYRACQKMDQNTTCAIEALDERSITPERACGSYAICGLLNYAKRRALRVSTLLLLNSGDTSGELERVVGYGAYAFSTPQS